jgi:hypothetical protein
MRTAKFVVLVFGLVSAGVMFARSKACAAAADDALLREFFNLSDERSADA